MTKTWREGEAWLREDGAPAGPSFDITIASSRKGHGPYRMYRDTVTSTILHQPPCASWEHRGPGLCRHVSESIIRAERPAEHFLACVASLRAESSWWASRDESHNFSVRVIRMMEEALEAKEQIAQAARLAARAPVSAADAEREFV